MILSVSLAIRKFPDGVENALSMPKKKAPKSKSANILLNPFFRIALRYPCVGQGAQEAKMGAMDASYDAIHGKSGPEVVRESGRSTDEHSRRTQSTERCVCRPHGVPVTLSTAHSKPYAVRLSYSANDSRGQRPRRLAVLGRPTRDPNSETLLLSVLLAFVTRFP